MGKKTNLTKRERETIKSRTDGGVTVSNIIRDIREHYGSEWSAMRKEILHTFHIAKTCESKSMMMVFLVPGREQVEFKVKYVHGTLWRGKQATPYFYTTLAGLPVGEEELRELVG